MIVRSSVFMLVRQLVVQTTMVICGIVMARSNSQAEFGVYALCNFLVLLLGLCSDLGLGGWLIRAPRPPQEDELQTAFTVRQSIDLMSALLFLAASPLLARWYALEPVTLSSVRLLAAVPLTASFGLVPMLRLERELRFHWIAAVEIVQILVFGSIVLTGLHLGWGAVSVVGGWLGHAATAAILYQGVSPWRPRWRMNRAFLRQALPFSVPYQSTGAVLVFRDGAIPLLVGAAAGSAAVGVLNWAQMLALSIASGSFVAQRALLPNFARHTAPELHTKLRSDAELSLQGILSCVLSATAPIALYARPLCQYIFGVQWLPSLPIFYALWPLNLLIPYLVVMMALQNALGRSGAVLRAFFTSAVALWILTAAALMIAGLNGYPVALGISTLLILQLAPELSRQLRWNPLRKTLIIIAWISAASAAGASLNLASFPESAPLLILHMAIFAAVLLSGCGLLMWQSVRWTRSHTEERDRDAI